MRSIRHTPRMFDPRTGFPLKPAGRRKDGRLIWPIMGGSGEGDSGGDDGGDAGDAGGDDGGTDAGADPGDKDAGKDADTDEAGDKPKTFDEAYVTKIRNEAAEHRTEKQQLKGVLDAINKALNPDADGAEKVDPAKLQAQLADSTTAHTDLQREHQVLLSAIDAGADHKRLLDSRSFLAKVAKLDTTADDFAKKVKAEIETAIKEDPKLKSVQVAGSSSADHGGTGGSAKRTEAPSMQDAVNTALGT